MATNAPDVTDTIESSPSHLAGIDQLVLDADATGFTVLADAAEQWTRRIADETKRPSVAAGKACEEMKLPALDIVVVAYNGDIDVHVSLYESVIVIRSGEFARKPIWTYQCLLRGKPNDREGLIEALDFAWNQFKAGWLRAEDERRRAVDPFPPSLN
jgi:hypothetical protein